MKLATFKKLIEKITKDISDLFPEYSERMQKNIARVLIYNLCELVNSKDFDQAIELLKFI